MSLVFHFTRAATKAFPAGELSIDGDLSSVEPSLLIAVSLSISMEISSRVPKFCSFLVLGFVILESKTLISHILVEICVNWEFFDGNVVDFDGIT